VTDVVMPGGNGPELARKLTAARPDLKVLLMSGFAAEGVPDSAPMLQKPFSMTDLATRVRAIIGAAPG
jgi:two-component system cell cycle sensor histidine kinase/response regulator CckA